MSSDWYENEPTNQVDLTPEETQDSAAPVAPSVPVHTGRLGSEMLEISTKSGHGEILGYNFLRRISFHGDTMLTLHASECVIELEGTNLHLLREQLRRHSVEIIKEGSRTEDGIEINLVRIYQAGDGVPIA